MSESKSESKFNDELIKIYGRSSKENFGVVDTWPEKHPYCIGSKLVSFASDKFMGRLDEDAIQAAEKEDIWCETCVAAFKKRDTDKIMAWDEHKTGLLVQCLVQPSNDNPEGKELQEYLKKCIKIKHFIKQGYIGFVLLDSFKK